MKAIMLDKRRITMAVGGDNCKHCPEYKEKKCDGKADNCLCRRCPRNLGSCLMLRYCRETESALI